MIEAVASNDESRPPQPLYSTTCYPAVAQNYDLNRAGFAGGHFVYIMRPSVEFRQDLIRFFISHEFTRFGVVDCPTTILSFANGSRQNGKLACCRFSGHEVKLIPPWFQSHWG